MVLGLAGGSVIKTLVDEIGYDEKITGIEVDLKVIELAQSHFGLGQIKNFNLIHHEAFEFVLKTKLKYDFIIVDVFQDLHMPRFLFETFFQHRLSEISNDNGNIMFNTIILDEKDTIRNENYSHYFELEAYVIHRLPSAEERNELLIIQKKRIVS